MINRLIDNYILDRDLLEKLAKDVEIVSKLIAERIENDKRIIIVAVGSSSDISRGLAADLEYNYAIPRDNVQICEAGRNYRELMLNWREMGALKSTAVFDMQELDVTEEDIIIAISSSGKTEYTTGALSYANDIGATTVLITNSKLEDVDVAPKHLLSIGYDSSITNVRALEATTLMKIALDMMMYGAIIESGRMYNGQLVYQKWNSTKQKENIVNILISATGKSEEEVRATLEEAEWVTQVASAMLITGLSIEESIKRLGRIKGNFNKINN